MIWRIIGKYEVNNKTRLRLYYSMVFGLWTHQNHRLITANLSRQKELDADQQAIQQTKFVGKFKKLDNNGNVINAGADQSMFVLTALEKIKETRQSSLKKV